jgi:hypothetical protein
MARWLLAVAAKAQADDLAMGSAAGNHAWGRFRFQVAVSPALQMAPSR